MDIYASIRISIYILHDLKANKKVAPFLLKYETLLGSCIKYKSCPREVLKIKIRIK